MVDLERLGKKLFATLDKDTPRSLRKFFNRYNNKPYHKQTNFINRLKRRK
jgi:hypothetical protein